MKSGDNTPEQKKTLKCLADSSDFVNQSLSEIKDILGSRIKDINKRKQMWQKTLEVPHPGGSPNGRYQDE